MTKVIDPLTDEQLEEWAQALESGEYAQGEGDLCYDRRFCCLGVLADIKGELDRRVGRFTRTGEGDNLYHGAFGENAYYLLPSKQDELAERNDSGSTFPEIAAYIRSELMGKGGAA